MPQAESRELQDARSRLVSFERQQTKPEGLRALADALSKLSDLAAFAPNEREQRVARNLVNTCARKVQEHANQLITNFDLVPDNELEHWRDVMGQFEGASQALPESFHNTRSTLIRRLVERLLRQMSPSELEALRADVQAR